MTHVEVVSFGLSRLSTAGTIPANRAAVAVLQAVAAWGWRAVANLLLLSLAARPASNRTLIVSSQGRNGSVRSTAADVLVLVKEWDEITARLWRNEPYRKTDFERPAFQEYLGWLKTSFLAFSSVRFLNASRAEGDRRRKRIRDKAKPTQEELRGYARDFDRATLTRLLPQLIQAADQRGIDPGPFIELHSAMLLNAETENLADAAWTKVRHLQLRAEAEQRGAAEQQPREVDNKPSHEQKSLKQAKNKTGDESPTEADLEIGRSVLATMAKNPSVERFRQAVRGKGLKGSNAKLGKLLRVLKAEKK